MADPFDQSRSTFPDHFSANAAGYAIYRPAYPGAFVAEIAALAPRRTLAWDCATGNGQAARLLASHFDRVIATDASAEQIDNAVPHSRVQYRVGREDSSGAERRSVDDVTVSTALHWLDLEIGFRDLAFPFEERPFGERSMTVKLSREQFVGYVDTWSAVARSRREETTGAIGEFRKRLSACWTDIELRDVTWPLYSRIGRVPG